MRNIGQGLEPFVHYTLSCVDILYVVRALMSTAENAIYAFEIHGSI